MQKPKKITKREVYLKRFNPTLHSRKSSSNPTAPSLTFTPYSKMLRHSV
ncbi:hypothetical protein FUAX_24650 [Fulvitalea axinellae]|uniref:Uncharacterized protein n=1 Tax=Fulvitalea axinellae TaxID=1182444 RepID=A0AAU9CIW3_9BACT|nr:hypothetical protein FUAX_24650 [Fulvitalea axinellae]